MSVRRVQTSKNPVKKRVVLKKREGEGTGEISKTKNDLSMKLSSQKHVSFAPLFACFRIWFVSRDVTMT